MIRKVREKTSFHIHSVAYYQRAIHLKAIAHLEHWQIHCDQDYPHH